MVRSLSIAFFCLIFVASSLGQSDAPKEPQKQTIQGKVLEAKSGQPIKKVNVQVMGGSDRSSGPHSATTGIDGTFTIEGISPGRYTVSLEHAGFVQSPNHGLVTISVQPAQNLTNLVLHMQAAGTIAGKIVDPDGDPMPGVGVVATRMGPKATPVPFEAFGSSITNDLGEYRIANLRPGKYLVLAQPTARSAIRAEDGARTKEHLTYTSTYYPGKIDKSRAIAVEVLSGEQVSADFGILMTRSYRISGTVAGIQSEALTQLILAPKSSDAFVENPQLALDGNHFECQNVLPGTYVVMMMIVKVPSTGGRPDMQLLQLAPPIEVDGADVEGVQLHAEPGRVIRGKFRLDTAEKFDWTQLNVGLQPVEENAGDSSAGSTLATASFPLSSSNSLVSADGSFEIKNVQPGNVQLVIGAHSENLRNYYTKAVMLGGRDVADSGFSIDGDLFLDVLVSAKGATIDGNVLDEKGQLVAYSTIAVVPDSDHRGRPDSYQQVQSDDRGHFIVEGLNPGNYIALAFEQLQEDTRQPDFLKTYGAKGEKFEVEEGTKKTVTVKLIVAETETP